ncbi:EAL domain-containing protein [Burkholderia sp. WAC0059]|uniref:EAL domain-containing protein n=1 Tax=Burkholderia sp. WAC0059 TaxID=2066022 RepID=UPI002155B735|nr:EAL domain-containing protein [Burkholderia sp. WAC0059]
MSGAETETPKCWRRHLAPILVALVPIVVALGFGWREALHELRDGAELAAHAVRNQVETVLAQARETAAELVPLTTQTCGQVLPALRRKGAVEPYLRSMLLIDGDHIYCSSVSGAVNLALADYEGFPTSRPAGLWVRMVRGTPLRPQRAALLVGEPAPNGRSVAAVVEGQYLLDLLSAIAPLNAYRIELRVGDGIALQGGMPEASRPRSVPLFAGKTEASGTVVDVRVFGAHQLVFRTWGEILLQFLPFAALLSGVLMWLAYRVQQAQQDRQSPREQLLRAMHRGELHVVYQPLYSIPAGRCEGAEALLRWNRPDKGAVPPDAFIASAEEGHAIVPLTRHLLRLVADDFRRWVFEPGFHLGLNVAAEHLSGDSLVPDIHAFMADVAARQPLVVIEITERSLVENAVRARENLDTLRAEGARVAIDDFGTGYCSLSYLQKFPFDYLKVDQGFVRAIDPEHGDAPILDTIIGLAHRLGVALVAEGVETPAQFDYLRERGVTLIQGYLIGRPMPAAEFAHWYGTAGRQTVGADARPAAGEAAEGADRSARPIDG